MQPDQLNIADCSMSLDVPYPVAMHSNTFQTTPENNITEQPYFNTAMDGLPLSFQPKSCDHHVIHPDKPHAFTLAHLKTENKEDNVKYKW